jgi:hypothetical protein
MYVQEERMIMGFLHKLWIWNLIVKIEIESKRKNKGNKGYGQRKKA